MSPAHAHSPIIVPAALLAVMLLAGCASNAPYYKPRKQHGCDCPKWNAAPAARTGEVSAMVLAAPGPSVPVPMHDPAR